MRKKTIFNPDGYEAGYENLRIAELREDWADAVNDAIAAGNLPTDISGKVYDAGELDKNGDGRIDCITVIYKPTVQNISVGWSSPLWDYHYYVLLSAFQTTEASCKARICSTDFIVYDCRRKIGTV